MLPVSDRSAERQLISIALFDPAPVEGDPRCAFFRLLQHKIAAEITKMSHPLVENVGKLFGPVGLPLRHAPVHEARTFLRVAVDVDV